MLVELAWLTRRRCWSPRAAILRLAPGALMVVALRCALTGAAWPWIASALALSLPFHLADLARGRRARP